MTKHMKCKTPIYYVWQSMKARCENPKTKNYANYGGRGIRVCEEWRSSFVAFHRDMGDRPDGFQIDRIDNDGNYEPKNCRWATKQEQMNNTRRSVPIYINGVKKTKSECAKELGVRRGSIQRRIDAGWTPEKAATTKRTRAPIFYSLGHETKNISEWARSLGVARSFLRYRLSKGESIEQVIKYGNIEYSQQ